MLAEKKKGLGDALLGLFVVREGEPTDPASEPAASGKTGDATVDDLIARYASGEPAGKSPRGRSRPSRPPVPAGRPTVPPTAAGPPKSAPVSAPTPEPAADSVPAVAVDFPTVLRRAGLTDDEQARVDKALTLLHNLPTDTSIEIKRQIVAASLHAFAIPVDQILESVLLHIGAYERYIKAGEAETEALTADAQRRLAELEQEAARIRQTMQSQKTQQQGLQYACTRQKIRAQEILEFFGSDAVERVKQSSVKLRDRPES